MITVVCAWCKGVMDIILDPGESENIMIRENLISHGMCEECTRTMEEELDAMPVVNTYV